MGKLKNTTGVNTMADDKNSVVGMSLDDYFQTTHFGSIERAVGNNIYGFNHRQTPTAVPMNKDLSGLTFFVRPQLNLQTQNVRNLRKFYQLLTQNDTSVQRAVRTLLDPRLIYGFQGSNNVLTCPVVDNMNSFIPALTNNLNSISGFPDLVIPKFTSERGLYEEVYSQVDGIPDNFSDFNVTATFRNTKGDIIFYLFYIWEIYSSMVYEGTLLPYPDFIIENAIDYNTRIYRFILDADRKKVMKYGMVPAAFPISNPIGQFFDFNAERPYNDQSKDISIQFQCIGFECMDDIIIKEFNDCVQIFNPSMRDGARDNEMIKIDESLKMLFNGRGYPRVNPDNYEMEWWIFADLFRSRTNVLLARNLGTPSQTDDINESDAVFEEGE